MDLFRKVLLFMRASSQLLNSAVLAYSSLRPKAILGTATFSSRRAPYCHHTSDHQKARKGVAVLAQRILHHQRPHCPILSKRVAFTKVDLPDGPRFPPPNQLSLTELIYHLGGAMSVKDLKPFYVVSSMLFPCSHYNAF